MTARLTPLIVGVALVAAGVLILLRNLGLLPSEITVGPVLLIGAGVVVLFAGLRQERGDGRAPEAAAVSLDGAAEARVVCKHGAGGLEIASGAPASRLLTGSFAGGVRQEVRRVGERLEVTLRHPPDADRLFRQSGGLDWALALARDLPIDLELQTGASRVRLDLADVSLGSLRIQTGASDVDVRLPARGRPEVVVNAGAADVRVHVPTGMSASIVARSALASVSVDQARFPRANGGYRDAGYEQAADRATIRLEGGVASFAVD